MEFIRQRSKVMSEHFMNFVIAHELDMDADTWPADLRTQFDHDAGALIEEWKRKAQRMFPPAPQTDSHASGFDRDEGVSPRHRGRP